MKVTMKGKEIKRTGIAKNIAELLEDHEPHMTIKQLSEITGIGLTKLKTIIGDSTDTNGQKRRLNTDDLFDIAKVLNVSPYKVLTGNDDENRLACEELGLSNSSVSTLSEIKKLVDGHTGNEREYYENKLKALDLLIENQSLLDTISGYLFNDFNTLEVLNEKGWSSVPLTANGTFTIDNYASLFRLRIMDGLKEIRDKIRKGFKNETCKR